jgi:hypothetical protein
MARVKIGKPKQISIRGLTEKAERWLLSAHSKQLLKEWIETACNTPSPDNIYKCKSRDKANGKMDQRIVSAPSAYEVRRVMIAANPDVIIHSICAVKPLPPTVAD